MKTWSQGKSSLGMVHRGERGSRKEKIKSYTTVVPPWGNGLACVLTESLSGFGFLPLPHPSWVRKLLLVVNYPGKGATASHLLLKLPAARVGISASTDDRGRVPIKNTMPGRSGKWAPNRVRLGRLLIWGNPWKPTVMWNQSLIRKVLFIESKSQNKM